MEKGKGLKKGSEEALIPASVDPIKLADEIKRGMAERFFKEFEKYKRKKEKVVLIEAEK